YSQVRCRRSASAYTVVVGEGLWGDADEPPKGPGEVALVCEAETHGHPRDGHGALAENGGGALDPGMPDVPHGAPAGADPELASEVEPAHAGQRRQLVERNPLTKIGLDVRDNAPEHVAAQAALKPGWILREHSAGDGCRRCAHREILLTGLTAPLKATSRMPCRPLPACLPLRRQRQPTSYCGDPGRRATARPHRFHATHPATHRRRRPDPHPRLRRCPTPPAG